MMQRLARHKDLADFASLNSDKLFVDGEFVGTGNLIDGFRSFQLGWETGQLIKWPGLQDTILPILPKWDQIPFVFSFKGGF